MGAPGKSPHASTGLRGGKRDRKDTAHLIYDLRTSMLDAAHYDDDVHAFAQRLRAEAEARAAEFLDGYEKQLHSREPARSRGETIVELLTLGLALRVYSEAAERTPWTVRSAARMLLAVRRYLAWWKVRADGLRARLFAPFLPGAASWPLDGAGAVRMLPRTIAWMRASGEFKQEATRLDYWGDYLKTLPTERARACVAAAMELFAWFDCESQTALGRYSEGVDGFLAGEYARRGIREDQLFCGRGRAEYHLAMVAAELMNQGLRGQFEATERRAVLLPTCMRGAKAAACKARVVGVDMTCTGCDQECAVNRITRKMARRGVPVYLVPHASSFSKWLERWEREHDVGVVAVACLMNILAGGYEMRSRGIASQCVVLDYPGCEGHWRAVGIATGVDEERLVQIACASGR